MLDKVKNVLGWMWASPVTLPGLTYAGLFGALKWYRWHGVEGNALVWVMDEDKAPSWLLGLWKKWAGHAIGNVVVLTKSPVDNKTTLVHEQRHVLQCMRLGVFQPLIYGLSMLAIKLGCPNSDPYYDCPFEIDARRAAGQVVDVVGTMKGKGQTK